jgi:hypothetical protein
MNKQIATVLTTIVLTVMTAPIVLAQDDGFSGGFNYGPPVIGDDGQEIEGQWAQVAVTFDDPRLDGEVTLTANSDQLDDDGLYRYSFRIETEEGAWQGEPVAGFTFDDGSFATAVHLLDGEGAYDGLVAVAEVRLAGGRFSLHGRVVDGPFPEL